MEVLPVEVVVETAAVVPPQQAAGSAIWGLVVGAGVVTVVAAVDVAVEVVPL